MLVNASPPVLVAVFGPVLAPGLGAVWQLTRGARAGPTRRQLPDHLDAVLAQHAVA
jgi:hypothetical protein